MPGTVIPDRLVIITDHGGWFTAAYYEWNGQLRNCRGHGHLTRLDALACAEDRLRYRSLVIAPECAQYRFCRRFPVCPVLRGQLSPTCHEAPMVGLMAGRPRFRRYLPGGFRCGHPGFPWNAARVDPCA
jgi:hypothetical protein